MNLLMSFNSSYVMPALTTVYSLFVHNNNVNLFVFYTELSNNEMNVFRKLTKIGSSNKIEFVYIEEGQVPQNNGRFSVYTFYRFLAYRNLENVDRVLYIDSDVIIRSDISELYNMNFEGNCFVGCLDFTSNPEERLGLTEYVNAGVLLMNLEELRKKDRMEEYWNLVFDENYTSVLPDQDALNIVFNGDIKLAPGILWNCFPFYSNENYYKEITENARIIHYISEKKPWLQEYEGYWMAACEINKITKTFYEVYMKYLLDAVEYVEN